MKRSRKVELILVVAAAAALNECGADQAEVRRCVDENNTVVDRMNCQNISLYPTRHYHWYYGGPGGSMPIGTHASGGSAAASEGTTRGVIGGHGEAHAGGGHGGGE